MRLSRGPATIGLVTEMQRSHAVLLGGLAAMLVLSLLSSGYLIGISEPRVARYVELARHGRVLHESMLDQETGLRGWILTDDETFLEPFRLGGTAGSEATDLLIRGASGDPELMADVVQVRLAQQEWHAWAGDVIEAPPIAADGSTARVTQTLLEGKSLFDAYRDPYERVIGIVTTKRAQALDRQHASLITVLLCYLTAIAIAAVAAVRRQDRLATSIVAPVGEVLRTIDALRDGDLAARVPATDVIELDSMGAALGALATDLRVAGELAGAREARLTLLAARLAAVVRIAREVSGSASVRYVGEAVTSAAAELVGAPATLWVRTSEGDFSAARRSDDPHGVVASSDIPVPPVVLAAAAEARPTSDEGDHAHPLVLAGMVVGVLQVEAECDEDTLVVLGALLSTAAATLESARLHSSARDQADHDALTQLPNRRRMEADLEVEWERSERYGRPLSFIMIDLDHFKRLNDGYGHVIGDEMLHGVASALAGNLRGTDTAYRYGGEELAVLLRETDAADALPVAERLREVIAGVTLATTDARTTASCGLAVRSEAMRSPVDLVLAADSALYLAKRSGRNRVAVAGEVTVVQPEVWST